MHLNQALVPLEAIDHDKVRKDLQQITSVYITPSEQMSLQAVVRRGQLIYI